MSEMLKYEKTMYILELIYGIYANARHFDIVVEEKGETTKLDSTRNTPREAKDRKEGLKERKDQKQSVPDKAGKQLVHYTDCSQIRS